MSRCFIITALLLCSPISESVRAEERIPISGADSLYQPGTAVLLGEIHGTDQGPATVYQLACAAVAQGLNTTVGLEILAGEQYRIDAYIASDGSPSARDSLLAGHFWQRDYQDGRGSQAMAKLIVSLRTLSVESDADVRVVAIDDPSAEHGRDREMAERLAAAMAEDSAGFTIALMGNAHARLVPGSHFDPDYQPMGFWFWLMRPETNVISLELTYSGGTAWIDAGGEGIGVVEVGGIDVPDGLVLYPPADDNPYSGRIHLGEITASRPVKEEK